VDFLADFSSLDTWPEGQRQRVKRFRPVGATGRRACVIGDDSFVALDLVTRLAQEGFEVSYLADPIWTQDVESNLYQTTDEAGVYEEAIEGADHLFVIFQQPLCLRKSCSEKEFFEHCRWHLTYVQMMIETVILGSCRPPDTFTIAFPSAVERFGLRFTEIDLSPEAKSRVVCSTVELGCVLDISHGAWAALSRLVAAGHRPKRRLELRRSPLRYQSWITTRDAVSLILWMAYERIEGDIYGVAPECLAEEDFFKIVCEPLGVKPHGSSLDRFFWECGLPFGVTGAGQHVMPRRAMELGFRFQDTELDLVALRFAVESGRHLAQ